MATLSIDPELLKRPFSFGHVRDGGGPNLLAIVNLFAKTSDQTATGDDRFFTFIGAVDRAAAFDAFDPVGET